MSYFWTVPIVYRIIKDSENVEILAVVHGAREAVTELLFRAEGDKS